jgi:hypothetical protein
MASPEARHLSDERIAQYLHEPTREGNILARPTATAPSVQSERKAAKKAAKKAIKKFDENFYSHNAAQ